MSLKKIWRQPIFRRILLGLGFLALLMLLITFFFLRSYVSRSYEQRWEENTAQLVNTAGEYVDLALLDLGRAMKQQLWNTDITGAVLLPDEVSYRRKMEIYRVLSTFETENPLVEHAYLLTFADGTIYDGQGESTPLKESPLRLFLPEYSQSVRSTILRSGDFSTQLLTLSDQAALLQEFPTPENNGALLALIRREELLDYLAAALNGARLEVYTANGSLLFAEGPEEFPAEEIRPVTAGQSGFGYVLDRGSGALRPGFVQLLGLLGLWLLLMAIVAFAAPVIIGTLLYGPIGLLQREFEDTRLAADSLSREVAWLQPLVRERLHKHLLLGREMTQEQLMERLDSLDSPLTMDGSYAAAAITVSAGAEQADEEAVNRLYTVLRQSSPAGSESILRAFETVLMDDSTLGVILAFAQPAEPARVRAFESEWLLGLRDTLGHAQDRELVWGLSRTVSGLASLPEAWQDALADLRYRRYHGSEESGVTERIREQLQDLCSAAVNGDEDAARQTLQSLVDRAAALEDAGERRKALLYLPNRMVEELLLLSASEARMAPLHRLYAVAEAAGDDVLPERVTEAGQEGIALLHYYGKKSRSRYVAQAQEYIRERCTDASLSLDMVAEHIGISSAYLSRLLGSQTDTSFVNYVNRCRVDRACQLLRESRMLVQEVGFACGFNSLQNFNRVFKRWTGMTPGAYRRGGEEEES